MEAIETLFSIKQASEWASKHTGKNVTSSNISYLLQYGRIKKIAKNGTTYLNKQDLIDYYQTLNDNRQANWHDKLGQDLNWHLSFEQYKESETTKHVHRLHPYKGKFIPQLVEYFLDEHTDNFKKEVYFQKGDIVLDPFSGSGTTLVQANELGINAVGIDVSVFNTMMANSKIGKYDFIDLKIETDQITRKLIQFLSDKRIIDFETKLLEELNRFNSTYFPVPDYKYQLRQGEINEKEYGKEKETSFLPIYEQLVSQYNIKLRQDNTNTFLDLWYLQNIREEIEFVFDSIKLIKNENTKRIASLILSRTIRSCRSTTHADLATLLEPITTTYYCSKHGKICKPLFSILKWWQSYTKDTLKRLIDFDKLRTKTEQFCLNGDSRQINIVEALQKNNRSLSELVATQKIKGIFSSPPYVGLIDYHEQHAYAYDLFGFERNDELEIGPLYKGKGKVAQESYVQGISEVLNNCKRFLVNNYDVFLVANDKNNLYPQIAERSGMQIVNQFKRPVLNRTEKDKNAYSEIIFHLKQK